jgi:hypothetical protein
MGKHGQIKIEFLEINMFAFLLSTTYKLDSTCAVQYGKHWAHVATGHMKCVASPN